MPFLTALLLLASALAAGDGSGRADYAGGTVAGLGAGMGGRIQTTDTDYLTFTCRKAILKVLYERINLIEYGQRVSRRYALAVLISPVLAMSKSRKHFLTVGYLDDDGRQQAIVFQVHKNDIRQVLVSLEARTGRKVEFQDDEARKAGKG